MKAGIYKTNVATSNSITIPLSDPKLKFNDTFKVKNPYAKNGIGPSEMIQYDEDEPENAFFIQEYDGLRLNLEWDIYSPRDQSLIRDEKKIAWNPYIKDIVITKRRCSLSEVEMPNKDIGVPVETISGISGSSISFDLQSGVDRYLNFSLSVEDIFGNKNTGNLIMKNKPAEAKINNMYISGGFAHFDYTGSADLVGMNIYGFTGANIYGKIQDNEDFKKTHKVLTLNSDTSGKIPLYPRRRFHMLACPLDSAGESEAIQIEDSYSIESPSGIFFIPSHKGVKSTKKNTGSEYEIEYDYDWEENPIVEIKYKIIPTGELRYAVSGYEGVIAYDYAELKSEIESDSESPKKFMFDNLMSWQKQTNTGEMIELNGEVFGTEAGKSWGESGPRYSGENGQYTYAYIDSDTCEITCVTESEVKSGICPVQGTFCMPIDDPNSNNITFRKGSNFSKEYERASTYLKNINEMPAVILNKSQLNNLKQISGVKGWIGLRRGNVGCLNSLFSTNIQNNMFFNENNFSNEGGKIEYLDQDGDNRDFLSNYVGENWSWVNSSGDHIYKYAGDSGYYNMGSYVNLQTEYVVEGGVSISNEMERLGFDRPKISGLMVVDEAVDTLTIKYKFENSVYSGDINNLDINRMDFHTGENQDYTPDETNLFKSLQPSFSEDNLHGTDRIKLDEMQAMVNLGTDGLNLQNVKIIPYDKIGPGEIVDLNDEVGSFSMYVSRVNIEKSLDQNYNDGTDIVDINFEAPIKKPIVSFSVSTKNTEDTPVFLNAMLFGEANEDSVSFILSQPPPSTGYFLNLSVLAGDDSDD